jgi:DNA ligase-1
MTTLYKLNNSNTISWWEIEIVEDIVPGAELRPTSVDRPQDCLADSVPIGYNTWWGIDHRTQTRQTFNHQFTPASDKPSMSVHEQIRAQIDEQIARKGYSRELPSSPPELPMLAQTWADFVDKAGSYQSEVCHWPGAYIQPKLDGIRCIATPLNLYSRRNKEFTAIPHIEMVMNAFLAHPSLSTLKLDGELYIPGADLQTVQGTVSRKTADPFMYRSVEYHVFDIINKDTMTNRILLLERLAEVLDDLWAIFVPPPGLEKHMTKNCPIKVVPSAYVHGPTDSANFVSILQGTNTEFRNKGYEGVILRNPSAYYQPNYRTFDLIKYKEFADAEFMITDVIPVKNNQGVFVCKTLSGKTFKCTPAWTKERKEQILRYKDNYIGRQLTVKYERLSADGIPLKPIGVRTRDRD